MALHLITGRANAGKSGRAYRLLREAIRRGQRAHLVLPSRPDVERAYAELTPGHVFGVRVGTFHDLTESLWLQHGDGRTIAGEVERDLHLRTQARKRGIPPSVGRLAAECVELLAEQTGTGWRAKELPDDALSTPLASLVSDYATYLVENQLVIAAEANHLLRTVVSPAMGDLFVFHRFTDLTTSQLHLMRDLGDASDVAVTLTWEDDFEPTSALAPLLDRLSPDATESLDDAPHNTAQELQSLAGRLYSDSQRMDKGPAIRLCLAEGDEAEAMTIVEEVHRALADGAADSPCRIAVAFRHLERRRHSLSHMFRESGLDVDIDAPLSLASTAFGAALIDLLEFASTGERAPLLTFLRSSYSPLLPEEARRLEHRWRRRGVLEESRLISDVRAVNSNTASLLSALRDVASAPQTRAGYSFLSQAAGTLFASARRGADTPSDDREETAALASTRELLRICSSRGCDATFSDLMEQIRGARAVPRRLERPGSVQVMSLSRLRGRRFDTVILGGMNAGEFPSPKPESIVTGGAVDEMLRHYGGHAEERDWAGYERYMFYEAITRARRRLVLCAKSADSDGEALRLSPLIEAVGEYFTDGSEDAEFPADSHMRFSETPGSTQHRTAREEARADAFWSRASSARAGAAMRRAARRPMGITTPSGIEALLSGATFSASQIEAYLRCPYRWFYEMVLAPVELDREYEARDEGAFAHRLLASVYREVSEQGSGGLDQAALPDALSALQDAYEMECARQGDPASVREMAGRRKALQWARRIVTEDAARDDGFHPAFIEQEFGSEKLVSIGDFELRGRIDRVDVDAGGRAVVIDYKRTCRPRHSAGKLLEEGSVQLPLYLEAVRQALGLTPVAGVYRGLAEAGERGLVVEGALPPDRTKKKDMLAGADFDALVEQALELAQAAVAGMRAGDTSPAPRTATACTSCPVRPSCGRRS